MQCEASSSIYTSLFCVFFCFHVFMVGARHRSQASKTRMREISGFFLGLINTMEQKANSDQQGIQKIPYTLWIKGREETQVSKEWKNNLHHRNRILRITNKRSVSPSQYAPCPTVSLNQRAGERGPGPGLESLLHDPCLCDSSASFWDPPPSWGPRTAPTKVTMMMHVALWLSPCWSVMTYHVCPMRRGSCSPRRWEGGWR